MSMGNGLLPEAESHRIIATHHIKGVMKHWTYPIIQQAWIVIIGVKLFGPSAFLYLFATVLALQTAFMIGGLYALHTRPLIQIRRGIDQPRPQEAQMEHRPAALRGFHFSNLGESDDKGGDHHHLAKTPTPGRSPL